MALEPIVGGVLVTSARWRSIFWVNVPRRPDRHSPDRALSLDPPIRFEVAGLDIVDAQHGEPFDALFDPALQAEALAYDQRLP